MPPLKARMHPSQTPPTWSQREHVSTSLHGLPLPKHPTRSLNKTTTILGIFHKKLSVRSFFVMKMFNVLV